VAQGLVAWRSSPALRRITRFCVREGTKSVEDQGHNAVLVVSPAIRPWLSKTVRHRVSELVILSYGEIPDDQSVKVIHTVHAENKTNEVRR